ncbi:MAG TPA: hypothetical protein VLF62_06575 [Candidatus Saccharimonadales bacterium]|nr:hypothetical protein [Candidatus Saccharimonadales bacterium]
MSKEQIGKIITRGTLAGLGVMALLEGGCSSEPEKCYSPAAYSQLYSGDTTPGVTDKDSSSRQHGIMLFVTNAPEDAAYEGTVVGFTNPHDPNGEWHTSDPIGKRNASEGVIKLGIGAGDVQFRTQFVAEAGSPDCALTPAAEYSAPAVLKQLMGTEPHWQ